MNINVTILIKTLIKQSYKITIGVAISGSLFAIDSIAIGTHNYDWVPNWIILY